MCPLGRMGSTPILGTLIPLLLQQRDFSLYMVFFVYILYSDRYQRYYKGQTADLVRRLERHQKGLEKFTSPGRPWKLIWYTTKSCRAEAKKLENKLKNLSVEKLKRFLEKYPTMPISKIAYGH